MEDKTKELTTLSPEHLTFAQGILVHGNQTKAARDAGFSDKSARNAGYRLMKKADIRLFLDQAQAITTGKALVSHEYVLSNLREMVERCMQHAKVLDKKGAQVYIETADGKLVPAYTFNSAGAAKGLELLGKHLGTFEKDAAKEDERPAFVGISINMGEGTVKMIAGSPGTVQGQAGIGPPENVEAG